MTRPFDRLPIDPDVDADEDARHHRAAAPDGPERPRWPRVHADVVAIVFAGGCVGGYARYAVSDAWPASAGRIPWAVFGANVAGAFVLGLVVVIAAELSSSRYLRPLIGTGFCGALTTFSSVVVSADQLIAHGHAAAGLLYLVASIAAGLLAVAAGLLLGRAIIRPRSTRRPA